MLLCDGTCFEADIIRVSEAEDKTRDRRLHMCLHTVLMVKISSMCPARVETRREEAPGSISCDHRAIKNLNTLAHTHLAADGRSDEYLSCSVTVAGID